MSLSTESPNAGEGAVMICANPNCPKPSREFIPAKHNQRFCSDACKMQGHRAKKTISAVTQSREVVRDHSAVTRPLAHAGAGATGQITANRGYRTRTRAWIIRPDGSEEVETVELLGWDGAQRFVRDVLGDGIKGRLRILARLPGDSVDREHDMYFGWHGALNSKALTVFQHNMDMQGGVDGYRRQIVTSFEGSVVIFEKDIWS